jgi:mannose/fructose/N-acetylgalactosamine-specific phosphotransferase system component IID
MDEIFETLGEALHILSLLTLGVIVTKMTIKSILFHVGILDSDQTSDMEQNLVPLLLGILAFYLVILGFIFLYKWISAELGSPIGKY